MGAVVLPLGTIGRRKTFGAFTYRATPVPGNPEKITVTDDWTKNLITRPLPPELAALPGADSCTFHRLVAPRFDELVQAWREAGVLGDVLSWGGSYAARFVRGSTRGTLSAHAWGSAFDINVPWNGLGRVPAVEGAKGSVRRLVPIAERLGWYWGGRMTRPDGMHFELARV